MSSSSELTSYHGVITRIYTQNCITVVVLRRTHMSVLSPVFRRLRRSREPYHSRESHALASARVLPSSIPIIANEKFLTLYELKRAAEAQLQKKYLHVYHLNHTRK